MKFLLKQKGERGIFLFVGNFHPFVVAYIEDNNGLGKQVDSWYQGHYFKTLDDALKELG